MVKKDGSVRCTRIANSRPGFKSVFTLLYGLFLFLLFPCCQKPGSAVPGSQPRNLGGVAASEGIWFQEHQAVFAPAAMLKKVFLIFFATEENQLAYGTAFAVASDGSLVSNFHTLRPCLKKLDRLDDEVLDHTQTCAGYFAVSAESLEDLDQATLDGFALQKDYAGFMAWLRQEQVPTLPVQIVSHLSEAMSVGGTDDLQNSEADIYPEEGMDAVLIRIPEKLGTDESFSLAASDTISAGAAMDLKRVFALGFSSPKSDPVSGGFAYLKARFSVGRVTALSSSEDAIFTGIFNDLRCVGLDSTSFLDINYGGSGSAVFAGDGKLIGIHVGTWNGNCARPTATVIVPIFAVVSRFFY